MARPLHICIAGMHYAPEPAGNAPFTSSLARGLVARGHQVSVITGTPHYPDWRIFDGFGAWTDTRLEDGVVVRRLRHVVFKNPGILKRLIMELSWGLRASTTRWPGRIDFLLVVSPAMIGDIPVALRARRKLKIGLWVQDLYANALVETTTGLDLLTAPVRSLERLLLRLVDSVVVAHPRFLRHASAPSHRPPARAILNWTRVPPARHDRSDNLDSERITVLHAGNMGAKQGLESVIDTARLANQQGLAIDFRLVGGGNQQERLRELARGLENVHFLGTLSDNRYSDALSSADVLLVNELAQLREMSIPSKLTSYYLAGRPVVAATDRESTTASEIVRSGGGIVVQPQSPTALLEGVLRVARTPLGRQLASRGTAYAEANLSLDNAIARFESWINDCIAGR